jgi:hypothetical protein
MVDEEIDAALPAGAQGDAVRNGLAEITLKVKR